MREVDVVVAGGGIAGLLIANALASHVRVLLIEQGDQIPRGKYWLTDSGAGKRNRELEECIDRRYQRIDFVAYDGTRATLGGEYILWHTDRLIQTLAERFQRSGEVLTGHRVYSYAPTQDSITVRANSKTIRARLLIDCMGFGSPIVSAKGVAQVLGYYILCGCEVATRGSDIVPIALDNPIVHGRPTYFELFPTSIGTAHASVIVPSRQARPGQSLKTDLNFLLQKSHYSEFLDSRLIRRPYFGIIPVGRLHKMALDRIVFFGESGQTNPAASATGLSRMLHTYRDLAESILACLDSNRLSAKDLSRALPPSMTKMNRIFQECVFEDLLTFDSDDFRRLVLDLKATRHDVLNDLIFADFDFSVVRTLPLAIMTLLRPKSVLGPNIVRATARFLRTR